jgi:hypothetical protein
MSRDHSSLFHATRSEGQCLHPRLLPSTRLSRPLRPPSPVSSLRLVSESSAIGQCCCRRRCCCCFWSRPPPPPPHVWSQVTRGIDQRSSRAIFLRRVVPATLCHAPIFARTAAPVPAPRSLRPCALACPGGALRLLVRCGQELGTTTRGASPTEHERRDRGGAATPLATLHSPQLWHCTTGTATRLSRDKAHNPRQTTRQASRRPHCALSLCRLLPSTISAHHYAFSLSVGYSHPPSLPTTTLSRSLSATPIHHLCFSTKITHSLATRKASLSQRHGTFLFFVVLF